MTRSIAIILLATVCQSVAAFSLLDSVGPSPSRQTAHAYSVNRRIPQTSRLLLSEICNNDHDGDVIDTSSTNNKEKKQPIIGDPLRAAAGVRPSLHPTTINALASALKTRAVNFDKHPDKSLTPGPTVQPIDVALRAGIIAADAIAARQASSDQDGMSLSVPEKETIAGRVVGVIMRFDDLEATLLERVQATPWIAKYGDWDSFGVLADESNAGDVRQRIQDDPLFAMTRAECLLGLFLETVETPALEKAGQSVPDQGQIDFLDGDRKEVLLLGRQP